MMTRVDLSRARRLAAKLLAGLVALAVAALHAVILWRQLGSGELFEPAVAARWLASLALVAVAWHFRRHGRSLLRGRGALVLWLLVALLHATLAVPAEVALWSFEPLLGLAFAVTLAALAAHALDASIAHARRARAVALPAPQRGHLRALAGRAPPLG